MTLRRKMTMQIAATLAGLLLVCAAALWGVKGLRGDYGTASAGYRELREMYEVGSHVAAARTYLAAGDRTAAANEIDRAQAKLDVALGREGTGGPSALRQSSDGPRLAASFRDAIHRAAAQLKLPADDETFHAGPAAQEAIGQALGSVAAIAMEIRKTITQHEQAAERRWRQTLLAAVVVCGAVVLVAIGLGILQYRSVVTPLGRLRDAANRMAAGRLGERVAVEPRGAAEFTELAEDFNRMARELETLYRDLEQKVAAKSRELVRSERLASVGYLAAGVAHEINNPLSVITGYGERAVQKLEREGSAANGEAAALAIKSLRIMCEEAYRCKAITDKLLSLARPAGEEGRRGPVSLAKVAADVAALVDALPARKDRALKLEVREDVTVAGNGDELKQVLLNLVLNALDAVPAGDGVVTVSVEREEGRGRVVVEDNGRGMSPETLERVFEPFFTDKRGSQSAGTGLGLSISHAIVESHDGRLTAQSEGLEQGSRFTIEFPVASSPPPPA